MHIDESVNSSTIEWKPPYSAMNNDTIRVDPHITQYAVYITDNYTGNTVKENVTETRFTFNTSNDDSCLMYQVSAWNVGGEGELSEPVQESMPQGKETKNVLGLLASFYCCSLSITVPHRITAKNVTVTYTVKPNVLHFHIEVSSHPLVRDKDVTA